MPKNKQIEKIQAIANGHGGSRNAGKKLKSYNLPAKEMEPVAGDWMPIGITEMELPESPGFFIISEMIEDGYKLEEILAPEDMFPSMYRRVVNGNV